MDIRAHKRAAWNNKVERADRWTLPVSREEIECARQGHFQLLRTPTKLGARVLVPFVTNGANALSCRGRWPARAAAGRRGRNGYRAR